jgi:hypothetical protein
MYDLESYTEFSHGYSEQDHGDTDGHQENLHVKGSEHPLVLGWGLGWKLVL